MKWATARKEGEGEWARPKERGRVEVGDGEEKKWHGVGKERKRMDGKDSAKNEIEKWRLEENQSKIRVRMPKK